MGRLVPEAEGGGQRTEAEDGGQRTEDRGQRTEDGGQKAEVGGQRTEDGGQRAEDGRQKAEDGIDVNASWRLSPLCVIRAAILKRPSVRNIFYAFLTENVMLKERMGHFLPMVGFSFCLMRLQVSSLRGFLRCSIFSSLLVGSLALGIEFLQELLPGYFHRGFAVDDVVVALSGGVVGCMAFGLVVLVGCFLRKRDPLLWKKKLSNT